MNLVQMILSQFGPSVIARLASSMGLSSSGVQGALGAAIPAILAALLGRAQQPGGGEALLDAAQHQDTSFLDRLGDIVGSEQQQQAVDRGNSMLSSLLGSDKIGALQGALGSFTGMSSGSSGSLLGMAAPAIMAMLGKQVQSGGLNASGLVDMLMGQKDNIAAAMPKGFADQLQGTGLLQGISDKLGLVGAGATAEGTAAAAGVSRAGQDAASAARQAGSAASAQAQRAGQPAHHAATQAKAGGGIMRWLLPLIIAVVVLWALWNFFLRPTPVEEPPPAPATTGETAPPAEPVPAEPPPAPATTGETAPPAEPVPAQPTPAPAEQAETAPPATDAPEALTVAGVNLSESLNSVVSSITTTLAGVTNTEEAQAAVSDLESVRGEVDRLGELAGQLGEDGKSALASLVQSALPGIRSAADRALALPGVGEVLRPVVEPILQSLERLAQA